MRNIFFLTILMLYVLSGQAQEAQQGGIVYGAGIAIGASAPAGWVFDSKSAVSEGIYAVMYPVGSSWSKADEVMYVNVAKIESGTIDSFIAADVANFKAKSKDLVVEVMQVAPVSGAEKTQMRRFIGDAHGNWEAIVYAKKGTGVAIYVLSSRTQEGFNRSLMAFRKMVEMSFVATLKTSQ